jgi:predicted DNA-binding protein
MRQVRRIDLLWEGDEVAMYEALKQMAISLGKEIPEFVKEIIEREISCDED